MFGSLYCTLLKLSYGKPLKRILLLPEEKFPFEEGVLEVGRPHLLPVMHIIKPVANKLSHFDKATPSVKHFWLKIVIRTITTSPAPDRAGQMLPLFLDCTLSQIVDLIVPETFINHHVFQVLNLKVIIEDLLNHRSNVVAVDDGP